MTHQDKLETVHQVIKQVIKDCPFTFENLQVELEQDERFKMTVSFYFDEFGNANHTLGTQSIPKPPGCENHNFNF